MIKYFKGLSDEEIDKLKDAISLITVYIAGADGDIEEDELEWAKKIADIRSYSLKDGLEEFYEEVEADFAERVQKYVERLSDLETRNSTVENRLTELNPILAKIEPKMGALLYSSYVSFAEHVAKATGGFLGFFSIGPEEKALLDLKMLTPIVYVPEEDE